MKALHQSLQTSGLMSARVTRMKLSCCAILVRRSSTALFYSVLGVLVMAGILRDLIVESLG
ncbi:MAG TPA: hypothetical protein VJQ54_22700 [Candidatus Sulfotelmatobacter sp.]|nr:hypothetical protein [Candidatus Sulfotelmatobacter sp.]